MNFSDDAAQLKDLKFFANETGAKEEAAPNAEQRVTVTGLKSTNANVSVDGEVIPFRELYLESVGKTLKFLLPKGVMCAYADEDSSVKELLTV